MDSVDKILDIIENKDEFTTSDIQGMIEAIVLDIKRGVK